MCRNVCVCVHRGGRGGQRGCVGGLHLEHLQTETAVQIRSCLRGLSKLLHLGPFLQICTRNACVCVAGKSRGPSVEKRAVICHAPSAPLAVAACALDSSGLTYVSERRGTTRSLIRPILSLPSPLVVSLTEPSVIEEVLLP